MNIRPLSPENSVDQSHFRNGIHALYVELFGESAAPSTQLFERLERESQISRVKHWAFGAFLSQDEARLVGLVTLAESFAAFAGGPYLIMGELWVDEEYRSRGVGTQLIRHCEHFSVDHGYGRIDVSAPPDSRWDRTYAFYQTNGFVPTGRKLKLLCSAKQKEPS